MAATEFQQLRSAFTIEPLQPRPQPRVPWPPRFAFFKNGRSAEVAVGEVRQRVADEESAEVGHACCAYRPGLGITDGMSIARVMGMPVRKERLGPFPVQLLGRPGTPTRVPKNQFLHHVGELRWRLHADARPRPSPPNGVIAKFFFIGIKKARQRGRPCWHRRGKCSGLYIGSISASPTACPLRRYGRAGTQIDRLDIEPL